MHALQLRRATPTDSELLLGMMARFYTHFDYPFDHNSASRAVRQLLADESLGFVLLAHAAEDAVGYAVVCYVISLEQGGRVAVLDELYVAENQRNAGIGSTLMAAVERQSYQAESMAMMLEVEHNNRRAAELYRRSGYSALERHVMVKQLTG